MKIVLILMVKNESKILQRCLEAAEPAVDAFCITDTGSTDATVEIANAFIKTRQGIVAHADWKNFGHNRTISFQVARDFVRDKLKWDLKETYGLLLDGDMVFQPGTLRDQTLTEIGYTIPQCAGNLLYPNCRLVRMDYAWKCVGVTHEYWDGPTTALAKSVCWIDDRNDGGCKSDKFERDARLLEAGLAEEPTNVRYMFYLAQTYHSMGRFEDAIKMYKKRFTSGGWEEERWYSLYMIGQSYLQLKNPIKFEQYMLRAHALRPSRAEPLYKLTKYFRDTSQHYKAYHYCQLGRQIPLSTDSLFIETDVYTELFSYEETILDYYIGKKQDGLHHSLSYLLTKSQYLHNVYDNMKFYISPLAKNIRSHPILRNAVGNDYHPTSTCFFMYNNKLYQNVRFVNYTINRQTGSYIMCEDGVELDSFKVRTQNAVWDGTTVIQMDDSSVTLPRRPARILGLEDVRVYPDASGTLRFVSTSSEYSDSIRIVRGTYNLQDATYDDCVVMESPTNASCEKNWIPVPGTNDVIYSWNPLRVGQFEGPNLVFKTQHETPWFFRHLRGSSLPFRVKKELWTLVHFVEYSTPRKYFHCFVVLNDDYRPIRISLPFVFANQGIEYCLGSRLLDAKTIECIYSSWDDNPCFGEIPIADLQWLQVYK